MPVYATYRFDTVSTHVTDEIERHKIISFYVSHNCQRRKCHKFPLTSEEFGLVPLNHDSNT